jgi:hypothetical protein
MDTRYTLAAAPDNFRSYERLPEMADILRPWIEGQIDGLGREGEVYGGNVNDRVKNIDG